jgi:hypothetical protein
MEMKEQTVTARGMSNPPDAYAFLLRTITALQNMEIPWKLRSTHAPGQDTPEKSLRKASSLRVLTGENHGTPACCYANNLSGIPCF